MKLTARIARRIATKEYLKRTQEEGQLAREVLEEQLAMVSRVRP